MEIHFPCLGYKTLFGYKFIKDNCPTADFVVKVDDDVFVNIPEVLNIREKDVTRSIQNGTAQPADIYCSRYATNFKPIRCKFCTYGKYYSSPEEWPEDSYPPYCVGGAYAISGEWLKLIFSVRSNAGFYKIEDVFVTGKMRQLAEKKYRRQASFTDLDINFPDDFSRRKCGGLTYGPFVYLSRNDGGFEETVNCLWSITREFVIVYGPKIYNKSSF